MSQQDQHESPRQRAIQSLGTKEDWSLSKHNFKTSLHAKWTASDFGDINILKLFNYVDVSVTSATEKYTAREVRALNDAHVAEASKRAYELLNVMMPRGSPAKEIITNGSQNGTISIGDGLALFRIFCDNWSLLEADTTDTTDLALQLANKKMASRGRMPAPSSNPSTPSSTYLKGRAPSPNLP